VKTIKVYYSYVEAGVIVSTHNLDTDVCSEAKTITYKEFALLHTLLEYKSKAILYKNFEGSMGNWARLVLKYHLELERVTFGPAG